MSNEGHYQWQPHAAGQGSSLSEASGYYDIQLLVTVDQSAVSTGEWCSS